MPFFVRYPYQVPPPTGKQKAWLTQKTQAREPYLLNVPSITNVIWRNWKVKTNKMKTVTKINFMYQKTDVYDCKWLYMLENMCYTKYLKKCYERNGEKIYAELCGLNSSYGNVNTVE
jgi:hypothetical protein